MENKIVFENTKGFKLVGLLSNPTGELSKPIILLVHGHSSNKNTKSLTAISVKLNKKMISSFRIDLYGHGESEGKFEEATVSEAVDSILSAIRYLKEKGYTKIALVGSSYGGIASTLAASKTHDLFALVLKSPVSDYEDLYLWRGESIETWKEKGYRDYPSRNGILKLNYSFYEDAIKNDAYAIAPSITIPTLIVHGNADIEVPFEQSITISKLIPHCNLHIVQGADHTYTNPHHSEEMVNTIVDFLINITQL
jgi:dipeptidyl aminopeptidase/acylaminoacyl peptidase